MAVAKMFHPSVAVGLFYEWAGCCNIFEHPSHLNPALNGWTPLFWQQKLTKDLCLDSRDCSFLRLCAAESMYDIITEDYINQRIGEQMLTDDQWSTLTNELTTLLQKTV